jgi:uncharacterized RDD family membrane protein YckC
VRGGRAGWGAILIRNLLKIPDLIALPLLLLPMFTPLRQRLGDMVADTVVLMHAADGDGASGPGADHDAEHGP